MRIIITVISGMLLTASSSAMAGYATVTPQVLARAINNADSMLVPYRVRPLLPRDIRAIRCVASDEEPTEFQCKWRQRIKAAWVKRMTWLTIDGNGWRVMDA
jgi:hypothetical protein